MSEDALCEVHEVSYVNLHQQLLQPRAQGAPRKTFTIHYTRNFIIR